MQNKAELKRRIDAIDFAIYESVLFLDTHPTDHRAMTAFENYKRRRAELIREYESKFGPYIKQVDDVTPGKTWAWIKQPWPWENKGDD